MKTLFIVGGSSGIGYETALKFSNENYRIINLSRTECPLNGAINYSCDVTDRAALDNALTEIIKEHDVNCFVYSAGFSMAAPLEYVKEGDYRYLFEVNFFSFLHCLQILIPALKKTGGTACIISSIGAIQPIPFDAYYTSSKAALNALCKTLKYELAPEGINIISIMPGGTKTDFTKKRKIYSPTEADGYSKQMSLAVDALAKIEQNGMKPKSVASIVFKKCNISSASTVYSSGIINKIISFFSRLMPQFLSYLTGRLVFFMEDDD